MSKIKFLFNSIRAMQSVALATLSLIAIGLVGSSFAAALGLMPWLSMPMTFGETTYAQAGMFLQIATAVVTSSLLFLVPTNRRIMQLEQSHRNFHISMEDVGRAFYTCHTADRSGAFTMSSEFDAMRERLTFMRDHPELRKLEPEVLEVAAQMSQQSQKLAAIYSDDNIERAKEFLSQRQTEAEQQQKLIDEALLACEEIKVWTDQVEAEESIAAAQLDKLDKLVRSALPPLGYDILRNDGLKDTKDVFPMGAMLAAE